MIKIPDLKTMGEMIQNLEEVKGFDSDYEWSIVKQKIIRLNDEAKEALESVDKESPHKIAEELIDCIFFICSALHKIEKLTGINPDEKFLWKFDKNILRERNPNGLDTFGD